MPHARPRTLAPARCAGVLLAAAGGIAGDAIPDPRTVQAFPASGEFDRRSFGRRDPVADSSRPARYLSISSFTGAPAAVAVR